MKKIILSLGAVFAFGFATAQDLVSSKGEQYLPKEGDWSIGFNANGTLTYLGGLLSSSGSKGEDIFKGNNLHNTDPASTSVVFVGKRFTSDTTADRYIANFNFNLEKAKDVDAVTSYGFTAGYGKEWRKGTTRLQGYYGVDGLLGFSSPQKKQFNVNLGAQGFVGAEYFLFPKVALGAQYIYGVSIAFESDGNAETNKFKFNLGGEKSKGFGLIAATLNLYF